MIMKIFRTILMGVAGILGWTQIQAANVYQNTDDLNLTSMIQAADTSLFVRDSLYYNWCHSIVKDDNGVYHLFYARWPKKLGFYSWLTHSEIAHAISDRPEGPYPVGTTILKPRHDSWDNITMHNVQVKKFEGRYYMYYISTNSGADKLTDSMLEDIGRTGYSHRYWNLLRNNQRVGVAVSSSLEGPWKRMEKTLIEPCGPIWTVAVNPSVCQGKDGRYYMIVKGDDNPTPKHRAIQAVAVSDSPCGPFRLERKPAFADIPTEDVCVWYDRIRSRYYAVFHAHGGNFIGMITSEDGINWDKAHNYVVCKKEVRLKDGTIMKMDRMERPYIYLENDRPCMLSFAVKKGNDSFIVFYRLCEQ